MIKKLSQEVINQIAAGEVIERPSSVVKELLDNAIDAGSDRIEIKIKNGGISHIEVSDNGSGIAKKDLPYAFEAHATSKIENLEDLNEILSMGFRGEALSTIVSVSEVSIISKEKKEDFGYKITGKGVTLSEISKTPRDTGTTVIVENLFKEIPARLKYLRAESTEYRKVLEILIPFFLAYPRIHFTFSHNGKKMYNLPKVEQEQVRISEVLRGEFTENMLELFFDGDGMKISGYVAQPKYNYSKTIHQYIFINKRPINDKGIMRAVLEGFSRYIPEGKRVPFILNLEIKTSLVDVNVHPKKEEVRFMNPFRVYSAIEEAVRQALKKYSAKSTEDTFTFQDKPREINYKQQKSYNVKSGLEFSKQLLKPEKTVEKYPSVNLFAAQEKTEYAHSYFQVFNKYIIVELSEEIWVVDQHAASERIYYEKIQRQFSESAVEVQNLLIPVEVSLSEIEMLFVKENEKTFEDFGFKLKFTKNITEIFQVPSLLVSTDFEKFFKDLISEENTSKDLEKLQGDLISTIACHASIRSGQQLNGQEMAKILNDLKKCENSTSCPHGRPAVWKISKGEIDKKFYRTY